MPKRLLALTLCLVLAFACLPACSDDEDYVYEESTAVRTTPSADAPRTASGMRTDRPSPGGSDVTVEPNTWTIFVYLCASDLESDDGSATDDLAEMVAATGNEHLSVVVQTGGAKKWANKDINAKKCQRFHIQNTAITKVSESDAQNMGLASTLSDFLTWGVENYPAEHMGVILWNHGGGSLAGVCVDERFDEDALVLSELDEAFGKAYDHMDGKFEFVGFDACLMSTLETANVLASYANYMVGSEEWEPGEGWSYTGFLEYLANHLSANGAELGRVIAEEYLSSFASEEDVSMATLSVIDLAQMDALIDRFNDFATNLNTATADTAKLTEAVRAIGEVDNFGGNNRSEGYANMVDLGGLVAACSTMANGASEVRTALDSAVVYHGEGDTHKGASGLSLYYPLQVQEEGELDSFASVCVSPSYLAFVERIAGGVPASEASDAEGDSKLISFAVEPSLDDDGYYWFQLDDEGLKYASSVSAGVYQYLDQDIIDLGETYDVAVDWDDGTVYDLFDGKWLSLPDGQNLAIYPADFTDKYVVYTSPIMLNGEQTNLRLRLKSNGKCVVEGAWDGIDESGFAAKGLTPIQSGDVIVPLYNAWDENGEEITYEGEEFKVKGKLKIRYELLYEGEYLYNFIIDDVHGNSLVTDGVVFTVDENGEVYYEEA